MPRTRVCSAGSQCFSSRSGQLTSTHMSPTLSSSLKPVQTQDSAPPTPTPRAPIFKSTKCRAEMQDPPAAGSHASGHSASRAKSGPRSHGTHSSFPSYGGSESPRCDHSPPVPSLSGFSYRPCGRGVQLAAWSWVREQRLQGLAVPRGHSQEVAGQERAACRGGCWEEASNRHPAKGLPPNSSEQTAEGPGHSWEGAGPGDRDGGSRHIPREPTHRAAVKSAAKETFGTYRAGGA